MRAARVRAARCWAAYVGAGLRVGDACGEACLARLLLHLDLGASLQDGRVEDEGGDRDGGVADGGADRGARKPAVGNVVRTSEVGAGGEWSVGRRSSGGEGGGGKSAARAAQAGAARAARAARKARAGALAEGGARVGSGGLSDSSFGHALCEQRACEQRA